MESKFSLVCPHELDWTGLDWTGPYPEPAGATPQHTTPLLKIHFNIILSSKLTFSK